MADKVGAVLLSRVDGVIGRLDEKDTLALNIALAFILDLGESLD